LSWLVGLATGGLSLLSVFYLLVAWFVYAAFVASLGLYFSMASGTSLRAITGTLGIVLAVTAIPLVIHLLFGCPVAPPKNRGPEWFLVSLLAFTVYLASLAMYFSTVWRTSLLARTLGIVLAASVTSLVIQLLVGTSATSTKIDMQEWFQSPTSLVLSPSMNLWFMADDHQVSMDLSHTAEDGRTLPNKIAYSVLGLGAYACATLSFCFSIRSTLTKAGQTGPSEIQTGPVWGLKPQTVSLNARKSAEP
jgi:hypothetical protein